MTAIERLLYGARGAYGVSELTASPGVSCHRLVPGEGPKIHNVAVFHEARLTSAEAYPAPGGLNLPRDVTGFDCYDLVGGR